MAEAEKATEADCSHSGKDAAEVDSGEDAAEDVEEEESFLPDYPTLQDYSKALLTEVMKATKAANGLPGEGDDYDYYASFPGFRTFCNKMGSRVTRSISRLIRHQGLPSYWPPLPQAPPTPGMEAGLAASAEELEERMEAIIESNDILLERVGVLMDEACGLRKREDPFLPAQLHQGTAEVASWNKKDTGVGGVASYNFMASRNVPRPQVKFRDQVDNSNTPFVPLLRSKPNARQPLPDVYQRLQNPQSLNALISNSKEWALYRQKSTHPYRFELENFVPTEQQLQLNEPQAPGGLEDVPYTFITKEEELDQLIEELSHCLEFAIDLENHSYRSFQGFVCLMQISTRNHDYIIDTLELRHHMHHLLHVFTNPAIVKVMHGADWDIPWLQRDFGLYVVNLFDTGQASRVLQLPKYSLAFLLQYCCEVEADKQYQLADWRIRPLPPVMEKYAREDTHYLLYIYDRMRNELIRRHNSGRDPLQVTLDLSRDVCLKTYKKPVFSGDAYLKLFYKHKRNFNSQQLCCLQLLYEWRDRVAREEDESTGYVLPNHMLFQISEQLPREAQGVLACCTPIPTLLRQQLQEVFMLVQEAWQTTFTNELPKISLPAPASPPPSLPPSHPHTITVQNMAHTEPLYEPHNPRCVESRGPPVKPAPLSLSAIESECLEVNETARKQLQQIQASFPNVLAQFMEARSTDTGLPSRGDVATPTNTTGAATSNSAVTSAPVSPQNTSVVVSKATNGGKGLKTRRNLSVREMGSNKRRKLCSPQATGEMREEEGGEGEEGEEEREEGEVVEEEGEVKRMKFDKDASFTPFHYEGANFSDYTHTSHQPPVVFQPHSGPSRGAGVRERGGRGSGRGGGGRGGGGGGGELRSKVHMRSGERSHTYTGSRHSGKPRQWQKKV